MLDVGSGAGFPGIPLKIIIPTIKTTLLDSSRKKVSFQNFIIRKLGLTDALAIHARVDNLPLKFKPSNNVKSSVHSLADRSRTSPLMKEMNDQFDVIICRALFSLDQFVLSVLPLMTVTGRIVALKADINKSDLHTLKKRLEQLKDYPNAIYKKFNVSVRRYVLPFIEAKRSIVIVEGKEHVKI
jgi:16S rRNA (guanine527-N7)-methyltransferase